MSKRNYKNDWMIINPLKAFLPQEHLVRKLDNCIDLVLSKK